MARSRYRFAEHDRPHFLTCTVVEWLPVFTRQEAVQVLFDAWTHQQQQDGLQLYGFVVLENHLHAVAQAPDLPKTWRGFKSFTARQLLDLLRAYGAQPLLDRMAFAYKAHRIPINPIDVASPCLRQFWLRTIERADQRCFIPPETPPA